MNGSAPKCHGLITKKIRQAVGILAPYKHCSTLKHNRKADGNDDKTKDRSTTLKTYCYPLEESTNYRHNCYSQDKSRHGRKCHFGTQENHDQCTQNHEFALSKIYHLGRAENNDESKRYQRVCAASGNAYKYVLD